MSPNVFRRVALRHGLRKHPFRHRGFFRGVFDGRYKFARYFRPRDHHLPRDFDTLVRRNDLELYDTQADPHELDNLAAKPDAHRETLLRLNAKTNALIEREIGTDDGREHIGPRWLYRRRR
jgi:arylsulfatase